MLDLDTIANKTGLLNESDISWSDDDIPLNERGVHLEWLNNFVWEVYRNWHDVIDQHKSQEQASLHHYNGTVPWPDPLPYPLDQEITSEFLVPNVILPMTKGLAAPLFARVPGEYRGSPDLFVSHAWSNPLVGTAFAEIEALTAPLTRRGTAKYVWLDVVCYNQHHAEAIAEDMKAVVASIGRVGIPMINSVPFSRLWCLWELLCAESVQAEIVIYEANGSAYDTGYVAQCFQEEFKSVKNATTTLRSDRKQILNAMSLTFGSLKKADDHFRQLVNGMLSKDTDKPWKRSASNTEDV